MAKATKGTETQVIKIKPIKKVQTNIYVVGDSPLIVHAWSEKAKREMLDSQQKKKVDKKAKAIRDPFSEFFHALYWLTPKPEEDTEEAFVEAVKNGAKFGFPVCAVKQAALSAAYRAGAIPNQTGMKCSFFLNAIDGGDTGDGLELATIETPEPPECQESMVRIGGMTKVADLRYRPIFKNWRMHLKVTLIDTGVFNMDSVLSALEMGGAMNGIGEWRQERDGSFGMYHIEAE